MLNSDTSKDVAVVTVEKGKALVQLFSGSGLKQLKDLGRLDESLDSFCASQTPGVYLWEGILRSDGPCPEGGQHLQLYGKMRRLSSNIHLGWY